MDANTLLQRRLFIQVYPTCFTMLRSYQLPTLVALENVAARMRARVHSSSLSMRTRAFGTKPRTVIGDMRETFAMQTNHCRHFSIDIEILPVLHTAVILRVPIRRCALAERMIALISQSDEGREIGRKLTIACSTSEQNQSDLLDGNPIRVAFGPDLEAIHPTECTSERCQESCTPSFRMLVRHFGHDAAAERETGSGCLDLSTETLP